MRWCWALLGSDSGSSALFGAGSALVEGARANWGFRWKSENRECMGWGDFSKIPEFSKTNQNIFWVPLPNNDMKHSPPHAPGRPGWVRPGGSSTHPTATGGRLRATAAGRARDGASQECPGRGAKHGLDHPQRYRPRGLNSSVSAESRSLLDQPQRYRPRNWPSLRGSSWAAPALLQVEVEVVVEVKVEFEIEPEVAVENAFEIVVEVEVEEQVASSVCQLLTASA